MGDDLSVGRFCLWYHCLCQSMGYARVCSLIDWSAHYQEVSGKEARESCILIDLTRIASVGYGLALRSRLSLLSALLSVLSTALCQRPRNSQAGNKYGRLPDYFWLMGVPGGKFLLCGALSTIGCGTRSFMARNNWASASPVSTDSRRRRAIWCAGSCYCYIRSR